MMDVPAHVEHVTEMRNGVMVRAGTNWDISRGAAVTPIRPAPPAPVAVPHPQLTRYAPDTGLAGRQPHLVMTFAKDRHTVSRADAKTLCKLPKGSYEVAGHSHAEEKHPAAGAIARANAVASALRKCGLIVPQARGFGATLAAPEGGALAQRRVEVFLTP